MPKKTQNLWNKADEQILMDMQASGATFDQIADRLNRTVFSVRTRFYILNAEKRQPKNEGIDPALVCEGWYHPALIYPDSPCLTQKQCYT